MFRSSSFSLSEAIALSSVTIAVKYKKEPPRYSSAKSSSGRRMEEEMVHLYFIFNSNGVNYFHVEIAGLLFVATTRVNVSPSLVLELLQRIARVIKDYLGVLNEESLCKNFVPVYELLDEVIQGAKRMPGAAITKSIVSKEPGRKTEEIFVDVIEKISVTFSSSGYILTSEIDGTIQMKSYLGGNPEIRLALNNDLSVGRDYSASRSGGVILDDCNFHELVHLHSFDVDRTLTMVAPEGELHVMNYSITKAFKPPFRINAERDLLGVSFELGPGKVENTTDFKESSKRVTWGLKKIFGGSEHTLHARLTFSHEMHGNVSEEAGPINMTFTIPMHNVSGLQ